MLDRLSANALLKTVISALAILVVSLLGMSAWTSWQRLGAESRTLDVARASGFLFTAMHNLRTDRSTTGRVLDAPEVIGAQIKTYLKKIRDDEMPALRSAAELITTIDFAERPTLLPVLQRAITTLSALQEESSEALAKPKAARRESLTKDYMVEVTSLIETLEKLSTALFVAIKQQDPFIDQMMQMKQLAWMARNSGGEVSLTVTNGFATGKVAPEARQRYLSFIGSTETAWSALEDMAIGTQLPRRLTDAIAAARAGYFGAAYVAVRTRLLDALVAGEKPEMTANQWTPTTVAQLSTLLAAAEAALDAAEQHAAAQRNAAERDLAIQLGLVAGALLLAFGSMVAVGRRVIGPLRVIQDAMLKVAGGDLSAEAPFAGRRDEIGALAAALATFKQNAVEKAEIEAQQRDRHAQATVRQQAIETAIREFEGQIRDALGSLGGASGEMRSTADGMSATSEQTNRQVKTVAAASEEASLNVQTVAAASEQLSDSISEISRQVSHAATIAGRAVDETRETDSTVRGLAESAGRIGEVLKLISDIAGQTNLLALNATIEAARAGEAGKGFAVVASEVKSLASQTAKATEEIAVQIAAVQNVTKDTVAAIKRIGATIDDVSAVATAIASAVEQQGAATQEITRNTQAAARRTKDVSENIVGVTVGADETGAAAQGVKSAAEGLALQAGRLEAQVNEFLAKIRAA